MDHVCSIYQIKNCFARDCRFCVRWRAAMTFYLYFLFCHFILCIHTIIERLINYQWYSKLLSELAYTSNIFNTYWKYKWVVTVYQCRAFRWPIWTDRGFCTDLIIQSCIAYPSTLRTGFWALGHLFAWNFETAVGHIPPLPFVTNLGTIFKPVSFFILLWFCLFFFNLFVASHGNIHDVMFSQFNSQTSTCPLWSRFNHLPKHSPQ